MKWRRALLENKLPRGKHFHRIIYCYQFELGQEFTPAGRRVSSLKDVTNKLRAYLLSWIIVGILAARVKIERRKRVESGK